MAPARLQRPSQRIDLTTGDEEEEVKPAVTPSQPRSTGQLSRDSEHKLHSSREATRTQLKSGSQQIIDLDSIDEPALNLKHKQTKTPEFKGSIPYRAGSSVGLDQSLPSKRAKLETQPSGLPQTFREHIETLLTHGSHMNETSTPGRSVSTTFTNNSISRAKTVAIPSDTTTIASLQREDTRRSVPIDEPPHGLRKTVQTISAFSETTATSTAQDTSLAGRKQTSGSSVTTSKHTTIAATSTLSSTTELTKSPRPAVMPTIEAALEADLEQEQASQQLHEEERASQEAVVQNAPLESIETPDELRPSVDTQLPVFINAAAVPMERTMDAVIKRQLQVLRTDTMHSTRGQLRRARLAKQPRPAATSAAAKAVFAKLKPLQLQQVQSKTKVTRGLLMNTESRVAGKSSKKSLVVPWHQHNLKEKKRMPKYSHVVRLQECMLAPNITMLNVWPYFGDEGTPNEPEFKQLYAVDVQYRLTKLHQSHLAQWLHEAVEAALIDASLSWADILGFLFCNKKALLKRATIPRADVVDKDFPVDSARWEECNDKLGKHDNLPKAAHFCEAFLRLTGLSIWHVLRRSPFVRDYFADPEHACNDLSRRECRICYCFDCTVHGELKQHAESDTESTSSEVTQDPDARDIINPPQTNYRKRVCFEVGDDADAELIMQRKTARYWETKDSSGKHYKKPDDMAPFFPCNHPGQTCEEAGCSCFEAQVPCEKYCTCTSDCPRKFQGCLCSKGFSKLCFKDDRCACYQMGRECDPDLCGGCGVQDVLDMSKDSKTVAKLCRNANLQRGVPKHTLLGDSDVHELGLYACEHIAKDDFIGEYKGEILTKQEADRRGAVYEHQKLSYLFSLNLEQEVDSTYCGNKIRFINHDASEHKNAYAVIMLVNTVHRIGLWASRPIAPGEELFFDYGSQFPEEHLGGKKERKAVPKARNMAPVTSPVEPKPNSKSLKPPKKVKTQSVREEVDERDAGHRLSLYNIQDTEYDNSFADDSE